MLQSQINRRAAYSRWNYRIGDILTILNAKKKDNDLITEYGSLTKDDIKASLAYLRVESRQPQKNQMMIGFLLAWFMETYFYKISNEERRYIVLKVPSAVLLYTFLIQKVINNKRAATEQFVYLHGPRKFKHRTLQPPR